MALHVVWFKRDLRLHDHAPLAEAARRGPVLPLYLVEDSVVRHPDFDARHWSFLRESLIELRQSLARLGQPLVVRRGEAVELFERLRRRHGIASIWAHEETGNGVTYARDRAVRRWARAQGVPLTELPQHGVIRGSKQRDGWAQHWELRMRLPAATPPQALPAILHIEPGAIPTHAELGLACPEMVDRQRGGEAAALETLASFLDGRGEDYTRAMSSPASAAEACSRLSPHLAYGTMSLKRTVQASRRRALELRGEQVTERDPARARWLRSLSSFDARLHWHCHFIQKLEDEPRIEFENFVAAFDGLREPEFDRDRFAAWAEGRTGIPFVDACMRSLQATGWLNFRMRAMLLSFASYQLWLHWREPALHLARLFTDYEPGIHYSQVQMQSGTTGINIIRIYNPVKQGLEHDPDGAFTRRWVPELAAVPDALLQAPWLMPEQAGIVIGRDYPAPIVDLADSARIARQRMAAARRSPQVREQADAVQDRHGSGRSGLPQPKPRGRRAAVPDLQLRLL